MACSPAVAPKTARARGRPRALGGSGVVGAVVASFLLGGCASVPADPFAAPGASREAGEETHRVRFEVSCDECSVAWSLGPRNGGERASEALWREAVSLHLTEGESVRAELRAVPTPGRAQVSWVRIRLDGEVVAEARSEGGSTGELATGARIPPG